MTKPRKLSAGQLAAATYFMVAGGPYGLEELVQGAGYAGAIVALVVTPLVWSLPVAFMVSELSAAVPEEGGYYAWVKRALGPFWGFQEAWLSLMASVFDMAIYPTLFALYLGRLCPAVASAPGSTVAGVAMVAVCAAWNVRGARSVGGSSVVMTFLLLAPFAAMAALAFARPHCVSAAPVGGGSPHLLAAIMIAMWNCMGWDNASTVAAEVDRPQRTYPLAMLGALALVVLTYVIPVAAAWRAGVDPKDWTTGSWTDAADALAGPWLAKAVVLGGVVCGFGMFNALVLSYTRLPPLLAEDGYLPKVFARRHPKSGAPWVAILVCATLWAACLGLGFKRLVEIDVVLYGLSLLLEFAALVALRIKEPALERPFRVWGGTVGAALLGVGPAALIAVAVYANREDSMYGVPAPLLAGALVALGPAVYLAGRAFRKRDA
jgi:amino acid transporter